MGSKLILENFKSYYPNIPVFFTQSEIDVQNKKCEIQTNNYNNLNLNDYIIICFKNGNNVKNVALDFFGYIYEIEITSHAAITKEEEFAILAKVTRLSIDNIIGQIQYMGSITQGSFDNENPAETTISSKKGILRAPNLVGTTAPTGTSADMIIGDIPYYRTETDYTTPVKECVPLLGAGVILQVGSLVLIYVEKGHKTTNKQLLFKISGNTYQSINYLDLDMSCYIVIKITELSVNDVAGKCLTMKVVNNDIGIAADTALKIQSLVSGKKLSHKNYFDGDQSIDDIAPGMSGFYSDDGTAEIYRDLSQSIPLDKITLDKDGHIKKINKANVSYNVKRQDIENQASAEIRNTIIVPSDTDLSALDVPIGTIIFVKNGGGYIKTSSGVEELGTSKQEWHTIKREGFTIQQNKTWTISDTSFYNKTNTFMLRFGSTPQSGAGDNTYNRCLATTIIPKKYLLIGVDKNNGTHQCEYNGKTIGISFISESSIKVYSAVESLIELMAWY